MPYFLPKPLYRALNGYIVENIGREVDINDYMLVIIRKFLVEHKDKTGKPYLKLSEECLHESVFEGSKFFCCWDCGLRFSDKMELDVARNAQKRRFEKAGFNPDEVMEKEMGRVGGKERDA